MPWVIQWRRLADRPPGDDRCRLAGYRLRHPEPAPLNEALSGVGATTRVERGDALFALDLDTPAGPVTITGPGMDATALRMATAVARGLLARLRR